MGALCAPPLSRGLPLAALSPLAEAGAQGRRGAPRAFRAGWRPGLRGGRSGRRRTRGRPCWLQENELPRRTEVRHNYVPWRPPWSSATELPLARRERRRSASVPTSSSSPSPIGTDARASSPRPGLAHRPRRAWPAPFSCTLQQPSPGAGSRRIHKRKFLFTVGAAERRLPQAGHHFPRWRRSVCNGRRNYAVAFGCPGRTRGSAAPCRARAPRAPAEQMPCICGAGALAGAKRGSPPPRARRRRAAWGWRARKPERSACGAEAFCGAERGAEAAGALLEKRAGPPAFARSEAEGKLPGRTAHPFFCGYSRRPRHKPW